MQIGRKTSQNIIKYLADDVRAAERLNEAHSKNIIFYIHWDFRIKICCVKNRFGSYFDQSERRNEFLTREKNRFVQSQTTV